MSGSAFPFSFFQKTAAPPPPGSNFMANAVDGGKFNSTVFVSLIIDQSLCVGGLFTNYGGTTDRSYLVKLDLDGNLDSTFMANAVDGGKFNGRINSVAGDSQGNFYVGGVFTSYNGVAGTDYLVKFDSNGNLDSTFMANAVDGGKFNSHVENIAVDSNDNVYICGLFTSYNGVAGTDYLVKFDSNGNLDSTFMANAVDGGKFNGFVIEIALDNSDNVYVVGSFTDYNGFSGRDRFVRFNSDGVISGSYLSNSTDGSKFNDVLRYVAIDNSTGDAYIGGRFTNYGGFSGRDRLVKLDFSGSLDTTFANNAVDGAKFDDIVRPAFPYQGSVYIGGDFNNYGGTTGRNRLIKVDSNGVLDSSFVNTYVDGGKFDGVITYVTADAFDNIYISGGFTDYDGVTGIDRLLKIDAP